MNSQQWFTIDGYVLQTRVSRVVFTFYSNIFFGGVFSYESVSWKVKTVIVLLKMIPFLYGSLNIYHFFNLFFAERESLNWYSIMLTAQARLGYEFLYFITRKNMKKLIKAIDNKFGMVSKIPPGINENQNWGKYNMVNIKLLSFLFFCSLHIALLFLCFTLPIAFLFRGWDEAKFYKEYKYSPVYIPYFTGITSTDCLLFSLLSWIMMFPALCEFICAYLINLICVSCIHNSFVSLANIMNYESSILYSNFETCRDMRMRTVFQKTCVNQCKRYLQDYRNLNT